MMRPIAQTSDRRPFLRRASLIVGWLLLATACSSKQEHILLFEHQTAKTRHIYSVYPDGSQLTQLIELPVADLYWLSPDGKQLAALSRSEDEAPQSFVPLTLRVIDLTSGAILRQIEQVGQTNSEGNIPSYENVAWSPNGHALVFLRNSTDGYGTDIYLYDLKTGAVTNLTNDEAVERAPVWSPDGHLIAFATLDVCGQSSWDCPPEKAYWKIATIKPDGSGRRVIVDFRGTPFAERDEFGAKHIGQLCNLLWSPDAKYIAFEDDCREYDLPVVKEVFVAAVDGSRLLRLTNLSDQIATPETMMRYSVHWSKSSDKLFVGYSKKPYGPPSPAQVLREGILVAQNENFATVNITSPEGESGSTAQWSSDGHYVAWLQAVTNISGTLTVSNFTDNQIAASSVSASIPGSACYANHTIPINPIQWSPDGQYIAYTVAAQQEKINCAYEADRGIAVLSIRNNKLIEITKSLGGDNRLIGWFPAP